MCVYVIHAYSNIGIFLFVRSVVPEIGGSYVFGGYPERRIHGLQKGV